MNSNSLRGGVCTQWPTLLGLLSICLSKACLGPILQDQIANGENTLSKKMMRERVSCADREAGCALLKGCLSPKGSGNFPWLNNDFKTLLVLIKSASHADSIYSCGDYFDPRLPH